MTAKTEAEAGPSHDGSVVLDVGGDIGALVVHMPATLAGAEIELSPVGELGSRTHVSVRPRHLQGRAEEVWAAVYPSLQAGEYVLWDAGDRPVVRVLVAGGRVTETEWPGPERAAQVAAPSDQDSRDLSSIGGES
jgi:hypothetical protein